ncbi:MAG TPA: ROK family transcriptional regulator [Chloroflexia bacterium]|nr:ROK family transcriptional regulator [Chloroflexia bacterium]
MDQAKLTVRDLRRVNGSLVLRQIYFDAPISRLEISRRSGLSPATVTIVVNDLIDKGIVVESGSEESEGGRPRRLTTINPEYGYFIGVDCGETQIQVELFDLTLRARAVRKLPMSPGNTTPQQVVALIVEAIETLLAGHGIARSRIVSVGIGVPGLVDPATGVSIFAPNWGWHNIRLAAMLEAQLALPVYLDNGAKAVALAEMWFGAGRRMDSLAVLLIGTGVGSGIIANGSLYRGATNSAGEWGHTVLELMGRPCRCGSRGCLEAYVGAPGIIARLQEIAPQSPLIVEGDQTATIAAIIAAARQGDAGAAAILSSTTHYLGVGIANLINLVNPRAVLIGGWLGLQLFAYILPELRQIVQRYALAQPASATSIGACDLGQDALTLGAASLALEHFLAAAARTETEGSPAIAAGEAGHFRVANDREMSGLLSGSHA